MLEHVIPTSLRASARGFGLLHRLRDDLGERFRS
jgi:hypothetical protein